MNTAKEKLIDQIQNVYETDVGDFKRKAALYLNRFAQSQTDQSLKNKIQNLKSSILYQEISTKDHIEDIDYLRFALLEKIKKLLFS